MDFKKHCDRDEIRRLMQIKLGSDVNIYCAAEIDCICNEKVIESKCSKLPNNNLYSAIKGIRDNKLLKIWLQCYFGGADELLIGFQRDGKIQRIKRIPTQKIQELFPDVTRQCIQTVHGVLDWIKDKLHKQSPGLYHLHFDTQRLHNMRFTLKILAMDEVSKKQMMQILNGKGDKKVIFGLIIDPKTRKISLKKC